MDSKISITEQICKRCKKPKNVADFLFTRGKLTKTTVKCADCRDKIRQWRALHKEYCRNYDRQRFYGVTPEQYNTFLSQQSNCCALCGKPHTYDEPLQVDHCHKTDKLRALLCGRCNKRVMLAERNLNRFCREIAYVESFR